MRHPIRPSKSRQECALMAAVEKACPIVLQMRNQRIEVLAFSHPLAGKQFVKGTTEVGEAPIVAAERELRQESGLALPGSFEYLGLPLPELIATDGTFEILLLRVPRYVAASDRRRLRPHLHILLAPPRHAAGSRLAPDLSRSFRTLRRPNSGVGYASRRPQRVSTS